MKKTPTRRKYENRPKSSPKAVRRGRRNRVSGYDKMVESNQQKKADKISELEGRLESGDFKPRQTRQKVEAQLEELQAAPTPRRSGRVSGYDKMVESNQQKKADKISELEGRLERGDFKPRQTRQKVEAQLEELQAAPQSRRGSAESFSQAVEEGLARKAEEAAKVAPTPSPQRDRSESGERIRQGRQDTSDTPALAAAITKAMEDMGDAPIIDDGDSFEDFDPTYKDEMAFLGDIKVSDKAKSQAAAMMGEEPTPEADPEPMLRAEPVPELSEEESGRLFKMIMGSSFDPMSSMDKGKMEILKKAKAENPDLSDSQLALKIYKDYM